VFTLTVRPHSDICELFGFQIIEEIPGHQFFALGGIGTEQLIVILQAVFSREGQGA
jgi:hypothetical protein